MIQCIIMSIFFEYFHEIVSLKMSAMGKNRHLKKIAREKTCLLILECNIYNMKVHYLKLY